MDDKQASRYSSEPATSATPPTTDVSNDVSRQGGNYPSPLLKVKKTKGLLVTLIVAAVILIGLMLTYFYWYQNPNKVMSDAMTNAINSKSINYTGTIKTTGTTDMDVAIDGGVSSKGGIVNAKFTFDVQDKKYTLAGDGLFNEGGDLYFKVKDIKDLVGNYRQSVPAASQPLFDKIIAKVNDKWIKITADDLKGYSEEVAAAQKCTTDAMKKIQSDNAVKSELLTIYKKHPFIAIDKRLTPKDGSFGYQLKVNHDASKAFTKEYKKTSFYQTLQKCDDSFAIKDDDLFKQDNADKTNVAIWVDQWSHQITKVTLKEDDTSRSAAVDMNTKFNQPVIITTPKDATTLEQLQKDVQEVLMSTQSR
jgi:hypothetical protein